MSTVRLACCIDGNSEMVRDLPKPQIVARLSIDPQPVALNSVEALQCLQACFWLSDQARRTNQGRKRN